MEDELTPIRRSPLWQAVFKLDWALQQFESAAELIHSYLSDGKCGVREENDERGHRFIAFAERLPKDYPLLVGSGLHSLRSSLDTAVATLIEGVTRKPSHSNFPFSETEDGLRADFTFKTTRCSKCGLERTTKPRHKEIIECIPEFTDLVFDSFKPWKGGNTFLWSLNKLDVMQKHRMLTPALSTTNISFDYSVENFRSFGNRVILGPGAEIIIAESSKRIVYSRPPNVVFTPTLAENMPLGEKPLFEILPALYELVRDILVTLHSRFEGHRALDVY